MNLIKYLLLATLAVSSSVALAEGGAERSRQFVQTFLQDQQRLHGDTPQAVAERERKWQDDKARAVAQD